MRDGVRSSREREVQKKGIERERESKIKRLTVWNEMSRGGWGVVAMDTGELVHRSIVPCNSLVCMLIDCGLYCWHEDTPTNTHTPTRTNKDRPPEHKLFSRTYSEFRMEFYKKRSRTLT